MKAGTSSPQATQQRSLGHFKGRNALASLICAIAFTGCANTPELVETPTITEPVLLTPVKVADRAFTTDQLYSLLVAEMAIERRRYDIALDNYVQQANATRDPEVTARAARVARVLKAHEPALEMSQIWVELEPYNSEALLILTDELIEAGQLEQAFAHARNLLNQGEQVAFEAIAARAADGPPETTRNLTSLFEEMLAQHPQNPQLLVGYSLLLEQAKRPEDALAAATQATQIDPENIRAVYQESRMLQLMGKHSQAIEKMGKLIALTPHNTSLRTRYAHYLVSHDLELARQQYQILFSQRPQDADILLSLALVEMESELYESAISHFQQLIDRKQHDATAHYQLGKIHELRNRPDLALQHYKAVTPSQEFLSAVYKASEMMAQQDIYNALQYVKGLHSTTPKQYRDSLYLREANLLLDAGNPDGALAAMAKGLDIAPDSVNLLYSRAMLYTQLDNLARAEADFTQILELRPDNAAALNALGYTLADRTDRLDEAYNYISRALSLNPDDPAILDSMGWVEYRLGNIPAALKRLREAMSILPDHEIAAHLGEVLWVTGNKSEAIEAWKKGLENNPTSSVIESTLERLNATLP
ncbi:tetratricopeptide repeat protein [Saccharophagus degradans]|uniref:tetratricopeptide repeat protein n=1 Tax=Saccharophagus degradans TaxID=86304 RepID=UPI001C0885E5|nr:tetratricopeptide repeat protein [Saccharophagus degradans]MBU2985303.1 tetratricopeptide repeat protein [Saccharophagus degradans]